jgi:hypothetical protein
MQSNWIKFLVYSVTLFQLQRLWSSERDLEGSSRGTFPVFAWTELGKAR